MLKTLGMVLGLLASPVNQNAQTISNTNHAKAYMDHAINQAANNYNNNLSNADENLIDNPEIVKGAIINSKSILIHNQYIKSESATISMRSIYKDTHNDASGKQNNIYWVSGFYMALADFSTHNFYGEIKIDPNNEQLVLPNDTNGHYGLYVRQQGSSPTPTNNLYDIWAGYCQFFLNYTHILTNNEIQGIINYQVYPLQTSDDGYMRANLKVHYFGPDGNIDQEKMTLVYDFWNPQKSHINERSWTKLLAEIPQTPASYKAHHGVTKIHFTWYGKISLYISGPLYHLISIGIDVSEIIEKSIKVGHRWWDVYKAVTKQEIAITESFQAEASTVAAIEPGGGEVIVVILETLSIILLAVAITHIIIELWSKLKQGNWEPDKGIVLNFYVFQFHANIQLQ